MEDKDTSFELRSEEVQEILTRVPHWLIRWGSAVVFAILLLILFISWMVKYPDIVSTQIVITTNVPPQKLIAKVSGRIESILVNDKANVTKGTPMAIIENSANYNDVFLLKNIVDTINVNHLENFPFSKLKAAQLGDVESSFALFQKEFTADELNSKLQPYLVEGNAQSYEAIQIKERLVLLESQRSINLNELELQKNDLERYETLFKKGIVASQEIEKQRLQYLQAQKNYKNMLSSISQLKSSLNELNRKSKTNIINESKDNVNLKRNLVQAFYKLKNDIKEWELNYVLRSSINGKISYLQLWAVNQSVVLGDEVFAIIPDTQSGYIGKLKAPAQNSGKIKIGQKVNIRLTNYPDKEFGLLEGKIKSISLTPNREGYLLIDVSLLNGLTTSYNKKIRFQQEMIGSADIITEDLRLLQRMLYQFKDVFKR